MPPEHDTRPPITIHNIPDRVLECLAEWGRQGFTRSDIVACAIAMNEHNVIDLYTRNAMFLASTL